MRGLGVTPRGAPSKSLGEWLVWWERQVLEPVLANEHEDHIGEVWFPTGKSVYTEASEEGSGRVILPVP